MRILITAGPTREAIDPVRFLTNHSSGKMGFALAQAAVAAGHAVTLLSGPVSLQPPEGLAAFIPVVSASDMANAVRTAFPLCDALLMCAAVADYRPIRVSDRKIKKTDGTLTLELERTEDILLSVSTLKQPGQTVIGFAAETHDLARYAEEKIRRKNLDWIAANIVGLPDRGFAADANAVTLYSRDGRCVELPLSDKRSLAAAILEVVLPSEAPSKSPSRPEKNDFSEKSI